MDQNTLNSVLTFSEVQDRAHDGYNVFSIEGVGCKLVFFGCHHIKTPGHPMFEEIKKCADTLQPDLIFVEGCTPLRRPVPRRSSAALISLLGQTAPPTRDHTYLTWATQHRESACEGLKQASEEQVISEWGESGFIARYGLERGITVECPEPSFLEELSHVIAHGFSRAAIFGYYIFRMVGNPHRSLSSDELESYLKPWIDELARLTKWTDFDFSVAHLAAIGEELWGPGSLRPGDYEFYRMRTAPVGSRATGDGTEINEVSSASGLFRDRVILLEILSAREEAQRIFVVYGSGHSFTLEEALRKGFAA